MCDKKFPVNVRDNNRRNKGGAINEHFCLLATILKRRIILYVFPLVFSYLLNVSVEFFCRVSLAH